MRASPTARLEARGIVTLCCRVLCRQEVHRPMLSCSLFAQRLLFVLQAEFTARLQTMESCTGSTPQSIPMVATRRFESCSPSLAIVPSREVTTRCICD